MSDFLFEGVFINQKSPVVKLSFSLYHSKRPCRISHYCGYPNTKRLSKKNPTKMLCFISRGGRIRTCCISYL